MKICSCFLHRRRAWNDPIQMYKRICFRINPEKKQVRHPSNGWDSSVGIATRFWLYVPRIKSRWGEIFSTRPERPWCPTYPLDNGYRVLLGGKSAGAWSWLPTPSSAEVKERVEINFYSPFGPSWSVLR